MLRGAAPHDKDYVITGVTEGFFVSAFPRAFKSGVKFPVYRMNIGGETREIAFARGETKSGVGYRGFDVSLSPDTTIEDDLYRRDTTMNAIALNLRGGEIIDPYNGKSDISAGIIRAVSPHFSDDPIRALRAARQAAQFGYAIAPDTIGLMTSCRGELPAEPGERFVKELTLALMCGKPSMFFVNLSRAGILDVSFPRVHALVGRPQPPEHHPEGDAFIHTMEAADRAARRTDRIEIRFAALAHDLGKALTPDEFLPRHPDHDARGLDALREWNREMTLPRLWRACASFAISEHMRAKKMTDPAKIAALVERLRTHPIGADGFETIMFADRGVMPAIAENLRGYIRAANSVKASDAPPELSGKALGDWLKNARAKAVGEII